MQKILKITNIAAVSSFAAIAAASLVSAPAGTTLAYLTDAGDALVNATTVVRSVDPSAKIVEYFPYIDRSDSGTSSSTVLQYKKGVQVFNDGEIDCYVRVRLAFSDSDTAGMAYLSWDGDNYYLFDEFKTKVEENGWHYCEDDGYFYYKTALSYGDYAALEERMTKTETGTFDWNEEDDLGTLEQDGVTMLTTPLIKYVKTDTSAYKDDPEKLADIELHNYDITVTQDSVAAYLGTDYTSAWNSVLDYSIG